MFLLVNSASVLHALLSVFVSICLSDGRVYLYIEQEVRSDQKRLDLSGWILIAGPICNPTCSVPADSLQGHLLLSDRTLSPEPSRIFYMRCLSHPFSRSVTSADGSEPFCLVAIIVCECVEWSDG